MQCHRGMGYSTKFYTVRLCPEVHPLTIWNTINSKNKPRSLYFSKALFEGAYFWRGQFGRAYVQREICIIKSVGLACSGKAIYHFCFVLLCTRGQILSTSPPGDLYSDRRFNRGFLCYDFGGLIFAGAYTWRASFSGFYRIILTEKVPLSSTFFLQNMVPLSHT